jgi:hypothetical protein
MEELNYNTLKKARMAKFTNKQIELITDSVLTEIVDKKKELAEETRKSHAYVNYEPDLRISDAVYGKLAEFHDKIVAKQLEIDILNQEIKTIEANAREFARKQGRVVEHKRYYTTQELSTKEICENYLKEKIQETFKDLLYDEYQLKKDIETEILFLGESDAKKIREHLLTKFS